MLNSGLILELLSKSGTHEKKINALFSGRVHWRGENPIIQHPLIVLAFSNRSGSNYLAELIRSTGKIAGLGEALNHETVAVRCRDWGVKTFPEYFSELNRRHKLPFGVKASWDQLLMLQRFRIPQIYNGLQVIHIQRRDTVGQAISRDIAWQTGKWTSLTPVKEKTSPTYDSKRITEQLSAVLLAEAMFPLLFETFKINAVHVSYEELVAAPGSTVQSTMSEIGFPCPDWKIAETRIKKQANSTNDAFRERYREILLRKCLGHVS